MTQTNPEVSVVPTREEPKHVFLQPQCCVDWSDNGRQWCEDDFVWEQCGEPGCDCKSVRYVREDLAHQTPPSTRQSEHDANFLNNLALRMFKFAAPAQGFDQGDVDQLYRIARDISAPSATQPIVTVGEVERAVRAALKEAETANRTIAEGRSKAGSGHVKIATALHRIEALLRTATLHTPPPVATATVVDAGWQGIASAPRDGTVIDLWGEELGRMTDCYWGRPSHECGEMGQYCDSDWHGDTRESWVDGTFNERLSNTFITHWRATPTPPAGGQ